MTHTAWLAHLRFHTASLPLSPHSSLSLTFLPSSLLLLLLLFCLLHCSRCPCLQPGGLLLPGLAEAVEMLDGRRVELSEVGEVDRSSVGDLLLLLSDRVQGVFKVSVFLFVVVIVIVGAGRRWRSGLWGNK